MAEVAFLLSSSILLSRTSSAPSHHSRRRKKKPLLARPPLLSDVRRDLTAAPRSSAPASAATCRLLKYYARLASKLARAGRLSDFLMIAESILTSDAVAADVPQFVARVSPRLVSEGIASVLRGGGLDRVLEFVSQAERLGFCTASLFDEAAMETLAAECRHLVDEGRLKEFVGLMETLAGYHFFIKDIIDPIDILRRIIEKRDLHMAVRYASLFPHTQLLFCSLIEELGKKHDLALAIRVYKAFKRKLGGINMFACRSIIDVCGLCGDYLRSRSIFEELLAQKITPNIYVFNSLMNVNAHDLSYTIHVYRLMQNLGVTADLTSYNILLKACCNAKRVDMAQDIYKEIKYMESKGALKLDVFTYGTMIKVFADAKMWHMALKIKEDLLLADVSPNVVIWSSLISACAKAGLVDRAFQVFEEMLMAGCKPNAQCCNILLYACVESCQYDRAFRLFYTWKDVGFKIFPTAEGKDLGSTNVSSTVKHLAENDLCASACVCSPQPSRTVAVVPFRPTVASFNIMMKACGTDYNRAEALMDEMKNMGLTPNYISWSILIDIYGTSQNARGALQAFQIMQASGIKVDVVAYTTVIKACVENKNWTVAFSLFEEMKKKQLQPNWVTYNTLLRARGRYGSLVEIRQSLAIYKDMRKAGYSSNDYYLKDLIEEWCEGVLRDDQHQGLPSIDNSYNKTDTKKAYHLLFEKVAAHLAKDVGDDQAIDIRGLTKVEARIVILSVLRMIKERYQLGRTIQDDMIIITGVGNTAMGSPSQEPEVQLAVLKVLQDELGLDVVVGHGAPYKNHAPRSLGDASSNNPGMNRPEVLQGQKYLARRPRDLGILKVWKESLHHWLEKGCRSKPVQ